MKRENLLLAALVAAGSAVLFLTIVKRMRDAREKDYIPYIVPPGGEVDDQDGESVLFVGGI